MICLWVRKQLVRYSEGVLEGLKGRLVGSHVRSCSPCARHLEDLRLMARVFRRCAGPSPVPEASVWDSLEAALVAEAAPSSRQPTSGWVRPAALAGAAACLALGAFWLNLRTGEIPDDLARGNDTITAQGLSDGEAPALPGGVGATSDETTSDSASADNLPSVATGSLPTRSRVRSAELPGPAVRDRKVVTEDTRVATAGSPNEAAAVSDGPLPETVATLGYDAPDDTLAASASAPAGRLAGTATDPDVSPVPPFMGEGPPSVLLEPTTVADMHHPDGLAMVEGTAGTYPELDARSIEMIYSSPEERAKTIFNY